MSDLSWIDFENGTERRRLWRAFLTCVPRSREEGRLIVPNPDSWSFLDIGPLPDVAHKSPDHLRNCFVTAQRDTFVEKKLFVPHPITLNDLPPENRTVTEATI